MACSRRENEGFLLTTARFSVVCVSCKSQSGMQIHILRICLEVVRREFFSFFLFFFLFFFIKSIRHFFLWLVVHFRSCVLCFKIEFWNACVHMYGIRILFYGIRSLVTAIDLDVENNDHIENFNLLRLDGLKLIQDFLLQRRQSAFDVNNAVSR